MRRVVINHCWTGTSASAWYPDVARRLRARGFEVSVPDLPDTDNPVAAAWCHALRLTVGTPGEDLVLVGHSLGGANVLRYLESLDDRERVGAVVLVAGLTHDLGIPELRGFYERPFDYARIARRARRFFAILSDNDPYATPHPRVHAEVFERELGAQLTIVPGGGHFSPREGRTELDEVVARVQEAAELR
jgi:uncharacterized protein